MIVILYTRDLEPITCVDIPVEVQEDIQRVGLGKVPVLSKRDADPSEAKYIYIKPVRILGVDNSLLVFFTTEQEDLALAVTPQWLPGQLPLVQHWQKIIRKQQQELKRLTGGDSAGFS